MGPTSHQVYKRSSVPQPEPQLSNFKPPFLPQLLSHSLPSGSLSCPCSTPSCLYPRFLEKSALFMPNTKKPPFSSRDLPSPFYRVLRTRVPLIMKPSFFGGTSFSLIGQQPPNRSTGSFREGSEDVTALKLLSNDYIIATNKAK